jgi:uncharacterized membrane protein
MKNYIALGLENDPNTEHEALPTAITPTKALKVILRIPRPSILRKKDGIVMYSQYIVNILLIYFID